MNVEYISTKSNYVTEIVQMLIRNDDLLLIALIHKLLSNSEKLRAERKG